MRKTVRAAAEQREFDQSDPDPKSQQLDARNPVGCGLVTRKGQPLPNFEYPSGSLEKAGPGEEEPHEPYEPQQHIGVKSHLSCFKLTLPKWKSIISANAGPALSDKATEQINNHSILLLNITIYSIISFSSLSYQYFRT